MTNPVRRSATTFDSRARSPKRRKPTELAADERIDLTGNTSKDQEQASPQRFNPEEGIWPANRILRERGVGPKKRYLVEWENDPIDGTTYNPSWEPKANLAADLLKAWAEEKNKKSRPSSSRASSFQPSKHLPTSRSSASNGLIKTATSLRAQKVRPIIEDSSSILESEPETGAASHTPSLDLSPVSSLADYSGPASPAPEILETQEQPSAAAPAFSINIPRTAIDKSDYISVHGSQFSKTYSSPLATASHEASQRSLRSSTQVQPRAYPTSPSQRLRESLQSSHLHLLQAIEDLSPASHQVEVSASSDLNPGSQQGSVSQKGLGSVLRDSSSAVSSSVHRAQSSQRASGQIPSFSQPSKPVKALSNSSQADHLLSSAQPASQGLAILDTDSQGLQPIETGRSKTQSSSPWAFQSQFAAPLPRSSRLKQSKVSQRGLSALKLGTFELNDNHLGLQSRFSHRHSQLQVSSGSPTKMDAPAVRQSPRLQAATLASESRSPRTTHEQLRTMTPQKPDDEDAPTTRTVTSLTQTYGSHLTPDPRPSQSRLSHEFASAQAYHEPALSSGLTPQTSVYDNALGTSALPIQQSIEDEPSSSAEEHNSIASKASSSQVSLQNERLVPQIDGVSLPVQPVIGPAEYAIPLPAEGKIQSSYTDTINAKRKTILKFVHRRDSVGSAIGHPNRTAERNEIIDLMERLHDTITHFDLGLPGFTTQYSIRSEEATAYAQYAGSKFVFLGHLIDILMRVDCSLIVASKPGRVQDLLVDFLKMKHVRVHRFDRPGSARSVTPDIHQATLKIDVISTSSNFQINVSPRPILMIAFDSTFDSQSPHIARIRELNSTGRNSLLPVLHLLVQNSSEHVDRCLRKSMPSPQRLKLLVRATYQARTNLGGSPSYVPAIGDEPDGRPMDIHDLQRGVRKSPNRKLNMVAAIVARAAVSDEFGETWSLGDMPEIQYEELEESPPKSSRVTTTANTATATPRDGRARSRTPLSRAGTPSGRKRLLDVEGASSALSKRVRLSPMRDVTPTVEGVRESAEIEQLREQLKAGTAELATEKEARLKAEEARDLAQKRVEEWTRDHASLLRRYEKRRTKTRELDNQIKQLQTTAEFNKTRHEKTVESNIKLKEQIAQLNTELTAAREDLKKEGGDIGALEVAREEARNAKESISKLEKNLENTKRDFEFTRQQYQQASNRAAELGNLNTDLEDQMQALKVQASDEKRRLREVNSQDAQKRDLTKIESLEQENRAMLVMIKKLEDKIKVLEKGRGVQTRGSSVQPPGSPSMSQTPGYGTRSRQGSPAPGTVLSSSRDAREAVHAGLLSGRDRVSGLRHER